MAGGKLKGSTLLEVVIAMVIIMLVFGIAMMIFANVTQSSLSLKKTRARALLNEIMLNAEKIKGNNTQSLAIDDFRIEQVVKNYNEDPNLTEIELTAYDENSATIASLHKVIIPLQ